MRRYVPRQTGAVTTTASFAVFFLSRRASGVHSFAGGSAGMLPSTSLQREMRTVDTDGNAAARASTERSDVCALTACGVVLESALAFELCSVVLEQLGGSNMQEIKRRYEEMK